MKMQKRKQLYELLLIVSMFVLTVVIRFSFSNFGKCIETYPDELRYFGIARSLHDGTGISMRNAPTNYQKIAYSLLLIPFFSIQEPEVEVSVLSLLNCIIMCSSVFPVWLIAKKIEMSKGMKWTFLFFVLLWPDMLYSMTFMSEILYWPLFMWFIYVWIVNRERKLWFLTVVEGTICCVGYLCKEIFLAVVIAYIAFECIYPFLTYLMNKERIPILSFMEKKSLLQCGVFAGTFIFWNYLLAKTVFAGMGNSYNQMGLNAILSPYNFIFLIDSIIYNFSAILLSLFVVPFVYPIAYFKRLNHSTKKLFVFISMIIVITVVTIAYTISVREDLGQDVIRVHLRYAGPAIALMMGVFLNLPITGKTKNNTLIWWLISAALIIICVWFRGIRRGSAVDQYALGWYYELQQLLPVLSSPNGQPYKFSLYVIVINTVLAIAVYGLNIVFLISEKTMKVLFMLLMVVVCLINNNLGISFLHHAYGVQETVVEEIKGINNYLESVDVDGKILYITAEGITRESKFMDTYTTLTDKMYFVKGSDIIPSMECDIVFADYIFRESIWKRPYDTVESIPYIVLETGVDFGQYELSNIEWIPEIGGMTYQVYRNQNHEKLTFSEKKL